MELHAFERMAHSVDRSYAPYDSHETLPQNMDCRNCGNDETDCPDMFPADGGLLPQPKTAFPAETPLAMAYVPYQMWDAVYDAEEGIAQGSMFPSLVKPFYGAEGRCCK